MEVALIVAGSVLAGLLLIAFAVWAHQYTKVGPNEVLIISGRRRRKSDRGYRIVRGGGTYVRPFRERIQRLSLELLQFDVRTQETYTAHGVPVHIDGVCMVKIDSSEDGIERAATQFLSKGRDDIGCPRSPIEPSQGRFRNVEGIHERDGVESDCRWLAIAERRAGEKAGGAVPTHVGDDDPVTV